MTDQLKYTQKLKGDRVLVIGGSSGIGFTAAEAAVENGCDVIISSSQESRVASAVERLKKSYPSAKDRVTGYACGLGDENTIEREIEDLFKKVGAGGRKLDHIIYTAGDRLATIPIQEATLAKIRQAGMVRFFGPLLVAKVGSQYLSGGPKSSITLTSGSVGERPRPNWSVVASYAGGHQSMMRGLALDLKPIRVNLISPGAVETELWDTLDEAARQNLLKEMSNKTTVGKIGQPEDVAEAYMYCLKDWNLSGGIISTNGGALLM